MRYKGKAKSLAKQKELGVVVRPKNRETAESMVRRFKRMCKQSGLTTDIRQAYMERFKSKSEKKREKRKRAIARSKSSSR